MDMVTPKLEHVIPFPVTMLQLLNLNLYSPSHYLTWPTMGINICVLFIFKAWSLNPATIVCYINRQYPVRTIKV